MPLIAPFLLPRSVGTYLPVIQVWARETPDRLIVTWRSSPDFDSGNREFDVQAQLRSDGTIVFSYRKTSELSWPTVALMPGLPAPPPLPGGLPPLPRTLTLLDLSNPPDVPQQLPLGEVFQVPNLDVERVWAALKARESSYTDDDRSGWAHSSREDQV